MTVEKAYEIAKTLIPTANEVEEFEDAFSFYINDGLIREGGADAGIIIEKKSGKALRVYQYFMDLSREVKRLDKFYTIDSDGNITAK